MVQMGLTLISIDFPTFSYNLDPQRTFSAIRDSTSVHGNSGRLVKDRFRTVGLVEHRHAIGQGTHHRQVMRDKDIGRPAISLELGQEIEDGGLNRYIKGRRHLVA
jgi:hypothetical protein